MTKYRVKRPKDTVEVLILPNKDGSGYQYVNLTKGHICPCKFKTEIDALRDMDKKVSEGKVLSYEEIEEKIKVKKLEILELKSQIKKMKCDVIFLIKDRMNDDIDQNIIERLAEKWEIEEND